MSKKKRNNQTRAAPVKKALFGLSDFSGLACSGYVRLSENPEIIAAVNKIADLISSMTIHLYGNSENGDIKIKNELSRKIDINPNKNMTRKTFIAAVVRQLLLEGNGNAIILPIFRNGYLDDLIPVPPACYSLIPSGTMNEDYTININGFSYSPDEVVHCVINPDPFYAWRGTGYRVSLGNVAKSLKQAEKTKQGFMESKWKPSMIISVDAITGEFANESGRDKILQSYIENSESGKPWVIPAEQIEVKEVRPLSLNDIAIESSIRLDRRTVAAVLDVPPFVVGEGEFKESEWNNFVSTRIRTICNAIEQAFTKSLLYSPDLYFKFSIRSLYSYDIVKLSKVGIDNHKAGIMTGNEVRDWLGLSPLDGLDDLVILENFIPAAMIGQQEKLLTGGE